MYYFAIISYLGTHFSGFQVQSNARTVQGELTKAANALFGSPCLIKGCSRTDSGVHAVASCITIETQPDAPAIPADKIPLAIAPYLPYDLAIIEAKVAPPHFHVRHDVIKKRYVYCMENTPIRFPLSAGRVWQYPYPMLPDSLERMQKAAKHFIGKQDFAACMSAGSPVDSTIRTLYTLDVTRKGSKILFTLEADGFLYNMVRIIVGTLVDVGMGRIEPDDIKTILASGERKNAGETAPPEGLYLQSVTYHEHAFDMDLP